MRIRAVALGALVGGAFLSGSIVSTAFSQPEPAPAVYVVGFMKVDAARQAEYLQFERELWKPVHQERIRAGKMRSWSLYRVRFPFGTAAEYDFVTVNALPSMTALENESKDVEEAFGKVHPTMSIPDVIRRTTSTRNLVRGEVWELLDSAQGPTRSN